MEKLQVGGKSWADIKNQLLGRKEKGGIVTKETLGELFLFSSGGKKKKKS